MNRTFRKNGDGELRTDLAPIAERCPLLQEAESVEWMGGTTGESTIGPTTYWVDVVAVLPPEDFDTLLSSTDVEPVTAPALVEKMSGRAPEGPLVGSAALDEMFTADGASVDIALDPQTRTVMLSGMFE